MLQKTNQVRKTRKRNNNGFQKEILIENERQHILSDKTGFYLHESYNKLRSNIKFSLSGKGTRVVVVTSTNPSEGKSINALNLAISYGEIGQKVILVDCDMRKPKQNRLLNLPLSPGFSNVLVSDVEPQDAIKHDDIHKIDVITAGDIPPNSTTLLESEEMNEFIAFLDGKYDIVIFDTPPVNTVIDSCILNQVISQYYEKSDDESKATTKKSVGVVLVVKQDQTKREQLVSTVRQLEAADANIIGFVLNNIVDKNIIPGIAKAYYYGKYKYGYSYAQKQNKKKQEKKKFKLKARHIVVAIIIVFALTAGNVVLSNWGTIQMVYNGITKDSAEIEAGLFENDRKTTEILTSMTDKEFVPLSDEARRKLATGEISKEYAIQLIKGLAKDDDKEEEYFAENENSVNEVDYTAQDEIIAEIYLLRAEYLNEIDKLIETGRTEYREMKNNGQGFSSKLDLAESLANRGKALEEACDEKMEKLLQRLEKQIVKNGGDKSLIKEIRELYANEKELKKAQLVDTYYPKN